MWEGDNTIKHHTQERREVSPVPAGDHKATRTRQDSISDKRYMSGDGCLTLEGAIVVVRVFLYSCVMIDRQQDLW